MAVNVDDIDLIAARTAEAYKEAELQILGIMTHHLEQGIDAPTWTAGRLESVIALRRAAQAVIGRLASGDPQIRADVAQSYRNGRGGALLDLPGDLGDAARAARKNVPQTAAMDSLATALVSDIGERRRNVLRNVEDIYRRTQAAAVARMLAGGITRREASQAAWQGFVDQGVSSFTDRAGRTWRLTTYVEMAMRTVAMRAAVQGQVDQLISMGQHLVIVSDEAGECVRCRPWEGKVLRIGGEPGARRAIAESVTELADDDQQVMTSVVSTRDVHGKLVQVEVAGTLEEAMLAGLLHPNCGHALRAYLPGATRPPTRDTADPEHDKAKQRQRAIEREIRRHKEREVAALTPEAARAARIKVRQWQATMRQHLKDNPRLKRLAYREEIGAGNLPPGGQAPSPAGQLHGPPPPQGPEPKAPEPKPTGPAVADAESDVDDAAATPPSPPPASPAGPSPFAIPDGVPNLGDLFQDGETWAAANPGKPGYIMDSAPWQLLLSGEFGDRVTVKVERITFAANRVRYLRLEGTVVHEGKEVGKFARAYELKPDGIVATHSYLEVEKSAQGTGFSNAFNGRLIAWYRRSGVDRVEVHANIDVGGYAWASAGYDFDGHEAVEAWIDDARIKIARWRDPNSTDLQDLLKHLSPAEVRDQLRQLEDLIDVAESVRPVSAYEISQLGRQPGQGGPDAMWIGKALMLGMDWYGVLKLAPPP